MLNVPQLDDLSFEKLFERARSRIPTLTEEWTDYNAHDPGITMLQTFAWLVDMLNYYMDATGDVHILKYLKLLGIEPEQSAAVCHVGVESGEPEFCLPRGARLAADDTVFEVPTTYEGKMNRVAALYSVQDGVMGEITRLAGVDGGFVEIFSGRQEEPELYIGFAQPVSGRFRFYIEVEENALRNPFDGPFRLASPAWECYNGTRWRKAAILEDETCGFLRSGFLTLELEEKTGLLEHPLLSAAHYLKCVLREKEFDLLPRLGRVTANCLEVVQTHTRAQSLELVYEGVPEVAVDYCVREGDLVVVAVESPVGYVTWYEHSSDAQSLCEVVTGRHPWQRILRFDQERFGRIPQRGQKLLFLLIEPEVYAQTVIGQTTGCAGERMDFDWDGVLELRLALVRRVDGRACYELWERCGDLGKAGYEDRVFSYDGGSRQILFGDGLHGLQPEEGATVVAVTVKTCVFERGNVLRGRVNRLLEKGLPPLSVVNLRDAYGGKHWESPQELEQRLEQKLERVGRAVTAQDYVEIVKGTPGLMIDFVNVITMREYAKCYEEPYLPNTVILAVKPHTHDPHGGLSEGYRRRILENLEQYRLLTTRLRVVQPRYVRINASGRVAMRDKSPEAKRKLESLLFELIDFTKTGGFGRHVIYGKIFSGLEMLDSVERVLQFSFELLGKGARKNERGDIELYPDALAYLGQVEIEFV